MSLTPPSKPNRPRLNIAAAGRVTAMVMREQAEQALAQMQKLQKEHDEQPPGYQNIIPIGDGLAATIWTKTPHSSNELKHTITDWDDLSSSGLDFHNPYGPAVTITRNTPRKHDGHQRPIRHEWWMDGKRHNGKGAAVQRIEYGPRGGIKHIETERWINGERKELSDYLQPVVQKE